MDFLDQPGVPSKPREKKFGPRFASPVNSPAWDWADDIQFLQVTKGCSHNSCRFCTFYKNIPFEKVPFDEIEYYTEYLVLCNRMTPVHRVSLQVANAFHLSYDELMRISELLHRKLPDLQSIGGYGRMSDLRDKTVEQLKTLKDAGYSGLFFGVESADDNLLRAMNKGYDSAELYEAGATLRDSGMMWTCVVMVVLGGHGYGFDHAIKTAEFFNEVKPAIVAGVSLTLVYDPFTNMVPPLKKAVERGEFVEAGEIERYEEMKVFIEHLDGRCLYTCEHSSMPIGLRGIIPDHKQKLIDSITKIIEEGDEEGFAWFRSNVQAV